MGANRPGFKGSLKANLDTAKSTAIFVDIPIGAAMVFRFLPPCRKSGEIWHITDNHYGLKREDNPERGMAVANLAFHGTAETGKADYLNELAAVLEKSKDKGDKEIAEKITPNKNWYAQVLVCEKNDDGTFSYFGPKLLRVPVTGTRAVNEILTACDMAGEEFPFDHDKGFNIMITHTKGSPWYSAQRVGSGLNALDDIMPGWADTYLTDVDAKLNINLLTYDEQRMAALRSFSNELDWDKLGEHGL